MITDGELTLKSGFKYQVELHSVKTDSMGNLHGGTFKNNTDFQAQIKRDARTAGSWKAVQEMNIQFYYHGNTFHCDILVQDLLEDYPVFQVVKELSM
ncbi:hypothetical protein FM038_021510 [Shewanella eurypsychrophilus]|uniref:Galectin n=1 Tax=Shewanella eurypsychrophilus TaxID=2593656 RepID=A0ABX6VDM1_9GAMM|nr:MULTISPECIES: hypothetical protein [Shewanella]QFU24466.1 hypothetical protein FS418_23205 [Shewanella sp. YLB-09]QPG59666.1 hypothetical protein FM038_021510 [Shewanella eurypsychrophilus]